MPAAVSFPRTRELFREIDQIGRKQEWVVRAYRVVVLVISLFSAFIKDLLCLSPVVQEIEKRIKVQKGTEVVDYLADLLRGPPIASIVLLYLTDQEIAGLLSSKPQCVISALVTQMKEDGKLSWERVQLYQMLVTACRLTNAAKELPAPLPFASVFFLNLRNYDRKNPAEALALLDACPNATHMIVPADASVTHAMVRLRTERVAQCEVIDFAQEEEWGVEGSSAIFSALAREGVNPRFQVIVFSARLLKNRETEQISLLMAKCSSLTMAFFNIYAHQFSANSFALLRDAFPHVTFEYRSRQIFY